MLYKFLQRIQIFTSITQIHYKIMGRCDWLPAAHERILFNFFVILETKKHHERNMEHNNYNSKHLITMKDIWNTMIILQQRFKELNLPPKFLFTKEDSKNNLAFQTVTCKSHFTKTTTDFRSRFEKMLVFIHTMVKLRLMRIL